MWLLIKERIRRLVSKNSFQLKTSHNLSDASAEGPFWIIVTILFALSIIPFAYSYKKIIFQSNIRSLYSYQNVFSDVSTWSRSNFGNNNSNSLWRYSSTEAIIGGFQFIGISPALTVRIFLSSLFFISSLSILVFFRRFVLKQSKPALLICLPAAIYYSYNVYTLNVVTGDFTLHIPHLLLPLHLLFIFKAIENFSKRYIVYFSLRFICVNLFTLYRCD